LDNHLTFLIAPLGFGSITPVLQSAGPASAESIPYTSQQDNGVTARIGAAARRELYLINNAIAALGRPFDVFFLLSSHLNDPYRLEVQILSR